MHPPLPNAKSQRVRQHRQLHRQLGPVGERSHRRRFLVVLRRKHLLCLRCTVRIVQALEISGDDRVETDRPDKPGQIHRHPGLVAIGVTDDDSSAVRIRFEHWTNRRIQLHIQQYDVFAVLYRVHYHL